MKDNDIYKEVDEDEHEKLKKEEQDWLEDDGTGGYADEDDEEEEEEEEEESNKKARGKQPSTYCQHRNDLKLRCFVDRFTFHSVEKRGALSRAPVKKPAPAPPSSGNIAQMLRMGPSTTNAAKGATLKKQLASSTAASDDFLLNQLQDLASDPFAVSLDDAPSSALLRKRKRDREESASTEQNEDKGQEPTPALNAKDIPKPSNATVPTPATFVLGSRLRCSLACGPHVHIAVCEWR
jgi:hypothetical protein